jgi:hypothetical protein
MWLAALLGCADDFVYDPSAGATTTPSSVVPEAYWYGDVELCLGRATWRDLDRRLARRARAPHGGRARERALHGGACAGAVPSEEVRDQVFDLAGKVLSILGLRPAPPLAAAISRLNSPRERVLPITPLGAKRRAG